MEKEIKKNGSLLAILFCIYALVSYLIFLRDDFILERISMLTNSPELLIIGRRLAKTLHVNSIPTALYFMTVALMFFVFLRTWILLKRSKNQSRKISKLVIRYSLVFMIISFFSFPSLSTDVFDYIASNRVLFVHGANPWIEAPQNFPQDDFIYLGSWKFRASVYGPVQFVFSSLIHILAGNNLVANIVGFKSSSLIFSAAVILLVARFLRAHFPKLLPNLILLAWNPLLHIEIIGNAHNDIIMAFFSALSIYLLFEKKTLESALSLAAATLAKAGSILFAPIIFFWIWQKSYKRSIKYLIYFTAFILLGFLTLGEGLLNFAQNLTVQLSLYLRSLPTILRFIFQEAGASIETANNIEKFINLPLFILLYLMIATRVRRQNLFESMVSAALIYFFLTSPMIQPWYIVWILPFLPFIKEERLIAVFLVFCFTSLSYYSLLFLSFYFDPLNFIWQIAMYAYLVFPPLFVWIMPSRWYTQIAGKRLN